MNIVTKGLLAVLAIVVAGGIIYVLRPGPDVDLSTTPPPPVASPIDNTVKFPPVATPEPMIKPITQDVPVTLKTNKGDIALTLHGKDAPYTVGNFVGLAQQDFYDNTTFHRVIKGFMIQGGDPLSRDPLLRARHGTGGPGYQFPDEPNARKVVRGVIAMANSGPNTNGSQFFIVTNDSPHLNGKHTVFGEVTTGMDIVDAIATVAVDTNQNPVDPVIITDIIIAGNTSSAIKPLE